VVSETSAASFSGALHVHDVELLHQRLRSRAIRPDRPGEALVRGVAKCPIIPKSLTSRQVAPTLAVNILPRRWLDSYSRLNLPMAASEEPIE